MLKKDDKIMADQNNTMDYLEYIGCFDADENEKTLAKEQDRLDYLGNQQEDNE